MGAQLIGIFVAVEGEDFDKKLKLVMPLLCQYLKRMPNVNGPGRLVRIHSSADDEQSLDHMLFQCLQTCVTIADTYPGFLTKSYFYNDVMNMASQ